ncbi:MAG: hypothetical protein DRQ47_07390 [Gammaproteobacteria bacterium]|nr:MAG: hypothetical protein DRQ47_07390 [Gammaproteobacteria bacterium]
MKAFLSIFLFGSFLTLAGFAVQATQICDHDSPTGECTTQKDESCEHARRIGMTQGCTTSGGTGHESSKEIPELTDCDRATQQGMAQGCSTSGGTGTSITHNPEDGNLGDCRQSYRAGNPALKGCGAQTPVRDVIPR